MFKAMVKGSYKLLDTESLCKRVILNHSEIMPNFSKLCKIALCLCITSVECEISFSTQNRIKNKFRCSLKPEQLDILMRISLIGPSVENYNVVPAIQLWKQKTRRTSRLMQPYQPRRAKQPRLVE